MAIMAKLNRQIRVSENRKEEYLNRGYNEVDESGKIIVRSMTGVSSAAQKEIAELTNAHEQLQSALDVLTDENSKLKAENKKLRDEIKTLKKE